MFFFLFCFFVVVVFIFIVEQISKILKYWPCSYKVIIEMSNNIPPRKLVIQENSEEEKV